MAKYFEIWFTYNMTSSNALIEYCNFLEENIQLSSIFTGMTLEEFTSSPLHMLAAEGLSVRIGENVKNLAKLAPAQFGTERWRLAAKIETRLLTTTRIWSLKLSWTLFKKVSPAFCLCSMMQRQRWDPVSSVLFR